MFRAGPVVCFSYLAAAKLWKVRHFPLANHGAEVKTVEESIAADGPMTAAVLAALGTPTLLLCNDPGHDANGAKVRAWLRRYGVATSVNMASDKTTPQIVVVADDAGTRTWFPHLPGVVEDLTAVDLSTLAGALFAYLDCYQLIEIPATRAIRAARAADVPLLLNLGGSPLSQAVISALHDYQRLVVQTSVHDAAVATALHTARSILRTTGAAWVIVTAGESGALALRQSERLLNPAFQVAIRHTHGAGAAFSGGLLYGLLHNWPMEESLTLASACGAWRCERPHHEPMPGLEQLQAFISSRKRMTVPNA